jgi:very-short-patch-repair endonuclease
VCIICPKHGEFWQIPNGHLEGKGCYHCGVESSASSLFSNTNEFIKKARQIHGDKYDYSKVEYKHNQTKVCIICPTHGEFWVTPNNHIGASNKCGCPKCKMSKLENFVIKLLEENNIDYIYECSKKDLNWLGRQRLDFYIPTKKIVLECQGLQHFIPSDFGGQSEPEKNLKKNIKADIKKFNKCTENGLNVLYIVDDKKSIIDIPIYRYNNVYSKEEFIKFITDGIKN